MERSDTPNAKGDAVGLGDAARTGDAPGTGDAESLMRLAWLEKRAELACRVASEDVRDPECRHFLRTLARHYAQLAQELRLLAVRVGGPVRGKPVGPPMGWQELLDGLAERTVPAALDACMDREDAAVAAYAEAEPRAWPPFVAAALDRYLRAHLGARAELVRYRACTASGDRLLEEALEALAEDPESEVA